MGSETASETHLEESKSHFTNYRKDDIIMLKRKVLTMLLALVLVVSMAVPALAATGSYGGGTYTYTLSSTDSKATATLKYTINAFTIKATVTPTVHLLAEDVVVTGQTGTASGNASVTAVMGNYAWSDVYGAYMSGEIVSARSNYYVGDTRVNGLSVTV